MAVNSISAQRTLLQNAKRNFSQLKGPVASLGNTGTQPPNVGWGAFLPFCPFVRVLSLFIPVVLNPRGTAEPPGRLKKIPTSSAPSVEHHWFYLSIKLRHLDFWWELPSKLSFMIRFFDKSKGPLKGTFAHFPCWPEDTQRALCRVPPKYRAFPTPARG